MKKDSTPDSLVPHHEPRCVWIVVADEHMARIFRKKGKDIKILEDMAFTPKAHARLTNKSIGRVASSSGGSVRHKYEPSMQEERQDSLSFAHDIAEFLDNAVKKDSFDDLIIAAAPRMLGYLRDSLSDACRARTIREINKNLTKHDARTIEGELPGHSG